MINEWLGELAEAISPLLSRFRLMKSRTPVDSTLAWHETIFKDLTAMLRFGFVGISIFAYGIVFLSGCGQTAIPTTTVYGTITQGGKPLTVDKERYGAYSAVTASFQQLDETSGRSISTFAVELDEQGGFELQVPPGTYRVAVSQLQDKQDALGGKFAIDKSPIKRDVSGPRQELSIELDNPQK